MDNPPSPFRQKLRAVLVFFGFIVLCLLPVGLALVLTDFRPLVETAVRPSDLALLVAAMIVGPVLGQQMAWRASRQFAKETFDPLFAGLKLTAAPYMRGRQYHGEWHGKHVDIYVSPLHRQRIYPVASVSTLRGVGYTSYSIEIFVESQFGGYIASGVAGAPMEPMPKVLASHLEEWRALAFSTVLRARPGAVHLEMVISKELFSATSVEKWLEGVHACAVAVEKLPSGPSPRSENSLERTLRVNRGWMNAVIQLSCAGFFLLLAAGLVLFFVTTRGLS